MVKGGDAHRVIEKALPLLADELKIGPKQIMAVATLLEEGNTIPFIARYRKEAHGNLDEVQLSNIHERIAYHKELDDRRTTVLKSIEEQGKLTDVLRKKIEACTSKTALEDLYLPYKPKRRTRAMIAKERGLEPLANLIMEQTKQDPVEVAASFVDEEKEVKDVSAALAGARDIVAERVAENAEIRGWVREVYTREANVVSSVKEPRPTEPTKYEQYYEFHEKLNTLPSHRFLAIRRGQSEGILRMHLICEEAPILSRIEEIYGVKKDTPFGMQFQEAIADGYKRLLVPSVEIDVTVEKKMKAMNRKARKKKKKG